MGNLCAIFTFEEIVLTFNASLIAGSSLFGQVKLMGETQPEVKESEAVRSAPKSIRNTKSKANESIHKNKKDVKLLDSKRNENLITEPG